MKTPITVAHGDGIGPEIMAATLSILEAAGADLELETIKIGETQYKAGHKSGIPDEAWDSLRKTKVFLKAPITTPQGGGYKSLNVTIRKTLGLFANVRPCVAYAPYVKTLHPTMDLVIVRENEEDLYAGIEHRQTETVTQCLKLITRDGCERIARYAFEFARSQGRKKVTCMTKDNIMKLTDGMFHNVFDAVAKEYSDIESDHYIIDIGSARLADTPEDFDVIVTSNLYGDIISDIAAQIAGSVGLGGSSNIGDGFAMFEAIHGSAPTIAGQNIANPSGLLQSAVMMMIHLGKNDVATNIQNAWLRTLEDGYHTEDLNTPGHTKEVVGTKEFAAAVIERLGQKPQRFKEAQFGDSSQKMEFSFSATTKPKAVKKLLGVDVFVDTFDYDANALGTKLTELSTDNLRLKLITNRGVKVFPDGHPETTCTEHWRCRFLNPNGSDIAHKDVIDLLSNLANEGVDFIKTEHLCSFDGEIGYSLAQGE